MTRIDVKNALSESKATLERQLQIMREQEGRIAARLDQTLITLSTGLFVFAIALLRELPTKFEWKILFGLSSLAFLLCVILVINAMQRAHHAARKKALKLSEELKKLVTEEYIPICEMSDEEFERSEYSNRSFASFWRIAISLESGDVKKTNSLATIAFAAGFVLLVVLIWRNLA